MTTVTLRPNGTFSNYRLSSLVGAATIHGALSDSSDASYAEYLSVDGGGTPGGANLDMETTTIPAGAVTKSITPVARLKAVGGSGVITVQYGYFDGTSHMNTVVMPAVSFTDYTGASVPVTLTQTQVDALIMTVQNWSPFDAGTGYNAAFADIWLNLVYATQPTVTGTGPTGTYTTTSQPPATWLYAPGSDGGPQTHYQVKIFDDATYLGGGFSPDTSTPDYDSGVVISSATTDQISSLVNDTYRMYVRAAQTINGSAHWSDWSFIGFVINVTTADVASVTATPDNTLARILVTVTRDGGSHAWEFVEVERSTDGGTTWESVRTADFVDSTGHATVFTVYDYETGNGEDVKYRARASWLAADGYITGAWTESSVSTGWVSTSIWLKDPITPANNLTVTLTNAVPDELYPRRQGVFDIIGGTMPVVRSDVLSSARGVIELCTQTLAQADALFTLLQAAVLLLQMPDVTSGSCPTPSHGWEDAYIAIGDISKQRQRRLITSAPRVWTFPYIVVAAPADVTV